MRSERPEVIREILERATAQAKRRQEYQSELAFDAAPPRPGEEALPPGAVKCGSCGCPVYFAKKPDGSGVMPVECEPIEGGNVLLYRNPTTGEIRAEVLGKNTPRPEGRPLRLNHFVTCPAKNKYRRKP